MRKVTVIYSLVILLFIGYSRHIGNPAGSGALYAQDATTTSQKNIKREKKKRLKEAIKADKASLKRHQDIQTKATRKRMKKHLKMTKKNVKNSHR